MKLYNSLSRQVEEVQPLHSPKAGVYTCGPTVYDYPHIGNWFTFIRYDLLVRVLIQNNYDVRWVLNITDVGHLVSDGDEGQDKLEKGAQREGKTAWQIAKYYSDYFEKALQRLNFSKPAALPKATEHIDEQIDMIQKLEDKGYTYVIDDGVYYDTSKFPRYPELAKLNLDEQISGRGIEKNPQKRQPSDFALWKFSSGQGRRDMEWDSPWGKGFPGWHIECSAIALKYLGPTVDVHCGGIDHLPLHHSNEIAQSEAVTGKPLAKYWMHTNHILLDEQKISKSQGNSLTLEDVESKGYKLQALRLLVMESHYRTQSKFSWNELQAASNRLHDYRAVAALRWQTHRKSTDLNANYISDIRRSIAESLNDDLNTPQALAHMSRLTNLALNSGIGGSEASVFDQLLNFIDDCLGLQLSQESDITASQKAQIADREAARHKRDWTEADKLRQELLDQSIDVRDTDIGPLWSRIN